MYQGRRPVRVERRCQSTASTPIDDHPVERSPPTPFEPTRRVPTDPSQPSESLRRNRSMHHLRRLRHRRGGVGTAARPMMPICDRNCLVVSADVRRPSAITGVTEWGRFVRGYNVHPNRGGAFGIDTAPDGPHGFDGGAIGDVHNMPPVCHLGRSESGVPSRAQDRCPVLRACSSMPCRASRERQRG